MNIENSSLIFNGILVLANITFIYFYYMQLHESRRAILQTRLTSNIGFGGTKSHVLEKSPQYLLVENISKNIARGIHIKSRLFYGHEPELIMDKKIPYLNPGETVIIPLQLGTLIEHHPELFEKKNDERGDLKTELTIPKKTLKMTMYLKLKWRYFYGQKDSYYIEWGSFENYPNLKAHPMILSWNKRDGIYIRKPEHNK